MSRSGGNPLASLIAERMGKPKSKSGEDDERLEGLLDEYRLAKDTKSKARALRAFVRTVSLYEKESK